MPDLDLDPKHVRHRNHPGREPVFNAGGPLKLAVYLGVVVVVALIGISAGGPLYSFIYHLLGGSRF